MSNGERMQPNPGAKTAFHREVHIFFRTCPDNECEPEPEKPVKKDTLWAYCASCAFEVAAHAVPPSKVILDSHRRAINWGANTQGCAGSGMEASVQPGPEASPKALWYAVDLEDGDDGDDTDTTGGD